MSDMDTNEVLELAAVRALARTGTARQIRQAAGLSLAEVASSLGVSSAAVCRWEHGQRIPRGERAQRYGALLRLLAGAS